MVLHWRVGRWIGVLVMIAGATSTTGCAPRKDATNPPPLLDPALEIYVAAVKAAVMPEWVVPPSLADHDPALETVVGIAIERDGRIRKVQVVKPSGEPSYDAGVLRAVEALETLPAPPDVEVWVMAQEGIFIRFRSSDHRAGP